MLLQTGPDELFEPLKLPRETGSPLPAFSNRGRDRLALVDVDCESGMETVVAEHDRVDVTGAIRLDSHADRPDLLVFDDGYPSPEPLTELGKTFGKLLAHEREHVDFQILGVAADRGIVTVARSVDQRPYEYFMLDLRARTSVKIGQSALWASAEAMSQISPVKFKARDGLEIAGYLTIPKGSQPKNLPAVLKIHGGPAQRDRWAFDPEVQFLANRGYAVMTVNYRGSTGYGKAFRRAGHGEVGKAIQDDIVDAAEWLISEGISDPERMAIKGASFGGYAAALAMTGKPGLFKAAILENAMTDIASQMRSNPAAWGLHLQGIKDYFGDADNEDDWEQMKARSPLFQAESVEGAILIIAGKKDEIVDPGQSRRFADALTRAGKECQAVFLGKEGHSFSRWQSNYRRGRIIELFLKKYLGGRCGQFELMNLAARILP